LNKLIDFSACQLTQEQTDTWIELLGQYDTEVVKKAMVEIIYITEQPNGQMKGRLPRLDKVRNILMDIRRENNNHVKSAFLDSLEDDEEYLTAEQHKELTNLIQKGWSAIKRNEINIDQYYDRLAVFWDSINEPDYASENRRIAANYRINPDFQPTYEEV
tara:strand:+ start:170 stop:649 length:480 start_codon:yes stop_codon:yes gene_type:complete